MAKQTFYLDDSKTREIVVSWRGIWKDISVAENGTELGSIPNLAALKVGANFNLSDNSVLNVYFSTGYGDQGLRLLHNGRPVKGTSGDPEVKLKGIFILACFIGGLNFIVGALGQFEISELLVAIGANWTLMVLGLLIGALGYVAWKHKSSGALIAIILLLAADTILSLYFIMEEGGRPSFAGIGLKVLFIIQFSRGFSAISEYKNWQRENRVQN